jgi:hypothetical protein
MHADMSKDIITVTCCQKATALQNLLQLQAYCREKKTIEVNA